MKSFLALLIIPTLTYAELKIGVASHDITPKPGIPLAGYYSERGATGAHDPLRAKVIVLESGGTKAALVALDMIGTIRPTVEEARKLIEAETDIPGENVMINATHSHTGPIFASSRRYDAMGGQLQLAREYTEQLPKLIARAVQDANSKLAPARAAFGTVQVEGLAFNRRFHMRDGSVGWNPGKLNPNIIQPAGPIDPEVQVVYFERQNQPLATYVNFAMHLDTVGGTEFSADYPFTLSECLTRAKHPDMVTLFTIGCAGDINHINVKQKAPQNGHDEAARIGTILAAGVLRAYEQLATNLASTELHVSTEMVKLPLPEISEEELNTARKIAEQVKEKTQPTPRFMEQVKAFQVLDVIERKGKPFEVEVQVIALGRDIAWVSLPGEIFVELGLSIKAGSPFRQTIVATLANGAIGYIPTRRAYSEGNYEVVSARSPEGSGEMVVEGAVRQLRKIFAGAEQRL